MTDSDLGVTDGGDGAEVEREGEARQRSPGAKVVFSGVDVVEGAAGVRRERGDSPENEQGDDPENEHDDAENERADV
ncbi:hypothetical protein ACFQL4_21610 [Halosimplex aquaticum]